MFIWEFIASSVLNDIIDWIYSQIIGFLGNFFAEMGSMGAELFELSWVQSIVLFFTYLAWSLYIVGLVVACFECGIEYTNGRGDMKQTALNSIKGFFAVSLFSVLPVRLYEFAISLQAQLTAGLTGYGTGSIAQAALDALSDFPAVDSITDSIAGMEFALATNVIMVLFSLFLMAYAVIKVFFANLKRGGFLLIQIAVGSLHMFSIPRGYKEGFIQWMKQVLSLCLNAFLQSTILVAGLMMFRSHPLLGIGLMLSASEVPKITGAFGADTSIQPNIMNTIHTVSYAVGSFRGVGK